MSQPSNSRPEFPIIPALVVSSLLGGLIAFSLSSLWRVVVSENKPVATTDAVATTLVHKPNELVEFLPPLTPIEQKIEAALDAPFECAFDDTPLTDAAVYIAEFSKIQVVMDVEALNDEAIPLDSPITKTLQKIRLRSGLCLILEPLRLRAVVTSDVLVITTATQEAERLMTRTYPVADVCRVRGAKVEYDFQSLIRLLEEISPDRWQSSGGLGTIYELSTVGSLTIRQSYGVHREILEILRSLRQVQRQDLSWVDAAMLKKWDDQRAATAAAAMPRLTTVEFAEVIGAGRSDAEQKIEQALGKTVSLAFQETKLLEAVQVLAERLAINIVLDVDALNEEAIPIESPISLSINNITARSSLELLLSPLKLTSVIENDVLLITTMTKAQEKLITWTYPVSDLIGPSGDYQSLIRALEEGTSGPWLSSSGEGGTITELWTTGSLIIRQTRAVHDQILRLIRDQRAAFRQNPNSHKMPPANLRRNPGTSNPNSSHGRE